MNEGNLIPFTSEQSREEAEKNGRKGGIKSGETRRRKSAMRTTMKQLLSLPVQDTETWNIAGEDNDAERLKLRKKELAAKEKNRNGDDGMLSEVLTALQNTDDLPK